MEQFVLNTSETRLVVDELNAVALYADWTNESPEIRGILDWFKSRSIPLTLIFSGQDRKVWVLRDAYTKSTLIEKLRKAGKSPDISAQPTRVAANR